MAVLVTEPTPFGLHDLKLAVETTRLLGVPCGVVINRVDIGDSRVNDFLRCGRCPRPLEIPDDRRIAEACSRARCSPRAMRSLRRSSAPSLRTCRPGWGRWRPYECVTVRTHLVAGRDKCSPPPVGVVLSGKGGTGKTSLVAALAALASNKVLADCDVDAVDLHLILIRRSRDVSPLYTAKKPG